MHTDRESLSLCVYRFLRCAFENDIVYVFRVRDINDTLSMTGHYGLTLLD